MKRQLKYVFYLFIFSSAELNSQNSHSATFQTTPLLSKDFFSKNYDVFGTRVFIENKGQFVHPLKPDQHVQFVFENAYEKVYFSSTGLVYEFTEIISPRAGETKEQRKKDNLRVAKKNYVQLSWIGLKNTKIKIEPSVEQSHYFSYGDSKYNSKTCKRLLYKNIYPHIDLEYLLPEGRTEGIKYNFILYPGSRSEDIKFIYSGDVLKSCMNEAGEWQIKTELNEITEHAPHSFYSPDHPIPSYFKSHQDTVGFVFPLGYDHSKIVTIDPWVTTTASLTPNSNAYDVDYDFNGNVYVYGGHNPVKVSKYNALGILQWTFGGVVFNPAWTSQPTGHVGNFAVDRFSGKTYIGQGVNQSVSGALVIRLDMSGNYDNFISVSNPLNQEIWDMGFHCQGSSIFVLGGGHTSNSSSATINTLSATMSLTTFQPTNTAFVHDIASHTIDDAGNMFVIYSCSNSQLNNRICSVNSTFNGNNWTMPSGYFSLVEAANKAAYTWPSAASNGFNCLGVNNNFLFYYDGYNLAAYSKLTGSVVATTTTGLALKAQGGIAVDNCNRLYLGGDGSILTYSFNGSSFAPLAPISLSLTSLNQNVFDIKLNKNTQTLFVCGSGFVGTYAPYSASGCLIPANICAFNQGGFSVTTTSITCATLGSATLTPNNGSGPFSYTWIPSNQTGSVASGLSPGTYTIAVRDITNNFTYSTTINLVSSIPFSGSVMASTQLNCYAVANGTATMINLSGGSGSQSYLWTNGMNTQNTATATGLASGNFTVTVTDSLSGCKISATFTITQPPPLITFLVASSPTACTGNQILLTAIQSGGTPGYNTVWSPGPSFSPQSPTYAVTQSTAGLYTYTVVTTDQKNCISQKTISLTFFATPLLSVSNASICPSATAVLFVGGANTYTWQNNSTGNSFTASPSGSSSYSVTGATAGCTASASAYVTVYPPVVATAIFSGIACSSQSMQLQGFGGTSYIWTGPSGFFSTNSSPVLLFPSPSNSGVYYLYVTSANNCMASASLTVLVNPIPVVSAIGCTICNTGTLTLNAISNSASEYYWSGPLGFTSNLQNPVIVAPLVSRSGFYTVTASNSSGCTNSAVAHVTVTALPSIFSSANGPLCEGATVNFSGSGGTLYYWTGPNGFNSWQPNPQINAVTMAAMGVYTLTGSTGPCVNKSVYSLTVLPSPQITISNNGPLCEGKTLQLSCSVNMPVINYQWTGPFFGSSAPNPIRLNCPLIYSGVYFLSAVAANFCSSQAQTTVSILQAPAIGAFGATVCATQAATLSASGAISYTWSGPGNFQSQAANITFNAVSQNQVGTYTVVASSANSCTNMSTANLLSIPMPTPSILIHPRTQVCKGETVHFYGLGGQYYYWYAPDGSYFEGKEIMVVAESIKKSGVYTLIVINENDCSASTSAVLLINELPGGELIGSKTEGCAPLCSDFIFYPIGASPTSMFTTWQIGSKSMSGNRYSHCFEQAGKNLITATVIDTTTSCVNKLNFFVNVFPKPMTDFENKPLHPVENIDEVSFVNTSIGEYQCKWNWHFINNNSHLSDKQNTSFLFTEPGNYPIALIVENKWGCSDSVVKEVRVQEDFFIYVPNVFTPNEDNMNDRFLAYGRGIKSYQMSIYNRWGKRIFESKDPYSGWDALYNGEPCKNDVYTWKMDVASIAGERKILTGHVTLLR